MHSKPTSALPRGPKSASSSIRKRKGRRGPRPECRALLEERVLDGTLTTVIRRGALCVLGAQVSRILDMENYNFYRSFEKAYGYEVEHAPCETTQMIQAGIVRPQARSVSFVRLSDLRSYLSDEVNESKKKAATRVPASSKRPLDATTRTRCLKSTSTEEAEAAAVAGLLLLAAREGTPCSTISA